MGYLFSSESVTSGHPDKLCDLISDSILDACLEIDPNSRVAIEVFVKGLDKTDNDDARCFIIIGGEISINSKKEINYEDIARKCAIDVGYSDMEVGMDASNYENCQVLVLISRQSEEISQGINGNNIDSQGAGDQGIIFGYATNESEYYDMTKQSYMPLPILLAHNLTMEITKSRLSGKLKWARPDGKAQVTIAYDDEGKPSHVDTIVIAIQHKDMVGSKFNNEELEQEFITNEVYEKIIKKVIPKELFDDDIKLIINGTGRFCKGGPHADAGVTGRKIIVDTYGGSGRHGGGAFSGKDPSKVDRSAAYYSRWVAKHIVASGISRRFEIQLAYSIGKAVPISINIETFGTSAYSNTEILSIINNNFDFRPANIIKELKLRKAVYSDTTSGGHFGRKSANGKFSWERIDSERIRNMRREIR